VVSSTMRLLVEFMVKRGLLYVQDYAFYIKNTKPIKIVTKKYRCFGLLGWIHCVGTIRWVGFVSWGVGSDWVKKK